MGLSELPTLAAEASEEPVKCQLLLLLGVLTVLPANADTRPPKVRCPGENTVEMRHCAGQSWEDSTARLQPRLPAALFRQWQETTRAVCAAAYTPFRDGTMYPQSVVGCDDRLNRALLKEYAPLNHQGDLERTP